MSDGKLVLEHVLNRSFINDQAIKQRKSLLAMNWADTEIFFPIDFPASVRRVQWLHCSDRLMHVFSLSRRIDGTVPMAIRNILQM